MTPDQVTAINRLAQRGYGIDRIDDIIPRAVVEKISAWRAVCRDGERVQQCTIFDDERVGDSVVCAKVKLYDRPAMRWFAFKCD